MQRKDFPTQSPGGPFLALRWAKGKEVAMANDVRVPLTEEQKARIKGVAGRTGTGRSDKDFGSSPEQKDLRAQDTMAQMDLRAQDTSVEAADLMAQDTSVEAADTSIEAADTSVEAADTSIEAADTSVEAADTSVESTDLSADSDF